MTVKEFYDEVGGGYEEMFSKFHSDDMIKKFLGIFVRDESYAALTASMAEGKVEEAFRAAHTLKGVVLNLNIVGLITPVQDVTEALRAKNLESAQELFPALKEAYETTTAALARLTA